MARTYLDGPSPGIPRPLSKPEPLPMRSSGRVVWTAPIAKPARDVGIRRDWTGKVLLPQTPGVIKI